MTVELDNVISVGNVSVAALVERVVCCDHVNALSIHGVKRTVAILIRRLDVTTAFEVDGENIDPDDLESRYPGHRAAFERLTM